MFFEEKILENRPGEIFYSHDDNVNWKYTKGFHRNFTSIKRGERDIIVKTMRKTLESPERQKRLTTNRKGQFEHKLGKHRFYYIYSKKENLVIFLEYSKKKKQKENRYAS